MAHAPPQLDLNAAVLATRDTHTGLKGGASDSERLLDAFVFVGARKRWPHWAQRRAAPALRGWLARRVVWQWGQITVVEDMACTLVGRAFRAH